MRFFGCSVTYCAHCWEIRISHMRDEEYYHVYIGWTCDVCFNWIDICEVHFEWSIRMTIVDPHPTHPLMELLHLGYDAADPFVHIGRLIACVHPHPR